MPKWSECFLKKINLTKKGVFCFLILIVLAGGFMIPSTAGYAATVPSYDPEHTFPSEPRDYRQVLQPADIAFDQSGNKYVADYGYHAIIKYDATGEYVTHWDLFNPIEIAVDGSSDQVYVARVTDEVHIFDDNGNPLHTFGSSGSGDGEFDRIRDIAVDDTYIYVADLLNHRVQIFNKSDRSFLTSVGGHGTGNGQLNNPSGLAVGSDRQLYVADAYNGRIQLFTFDSGTSTWSYHSKLTIANPTSLYLQEETSGAHSLHVFHAAASGASSTRVELTGHDLDAVDPVSIVTQPLDSNVFSGHGNAKMAWNPTDGHLYAADQKVIARMDDVSNRAHWIGLSTDQFNTAGGIAVDRWGKIYITDTYQHRIVEFDRDGTHLQSWGEIGSGDGELLQPRGIAVDSTGNLYVADTGNFRIQKFKPDGTFERQWGERGIGDGKFQQIQALEVDAHDNVYVASWKTVQKFDADGIHLLTFGHHHCGTTGYDPCTDDGNFPAARGVGFDSDGNVYISGGNYVNKFTPGGTFMARWGGDGTELGKFGSSGAGAIAVDDADRIHVLDSANYRLQVLQTNGTFLGEFGRSPVTSSVIADIAIDRTNQLYVLDRNHYNVKIFKPRASGPLADLAATGGDKEAMLTFSAPNGAASVTVKQRKSGTLPWIDATTRWPVTASSTEATVTGLAEDTEYEFKLEVTGGPHAGDSNIALAKTYETAAPITDFAATGGDREVILTFSPLTAATSVAVKVWDDGIGDWTDATTSAPVTAGATSATVIGLADDTYYYFYMVVIGGPRAGLSNTAGASTNPAATTPAPLTDLTATGGDRVVTLHFTVPTGATSVLVKQRVQGETAWTDATTDAPITETSTRAVVTGLADDTTYEFYLVVVGGDRAGDSNPAVATTNAAGGADTIPPEWPASSALKLSDMTETTIKLSWPEAQDNVAVTGYRIFVDGHQKVDKASGDFAYSVTDHVYSYTMTGLQPGTSYHFTVKAYDAVNHVSEPGLSGTAATLARPSGGGGDGSVGGGEPSGGSESGSSWSPSDNANLKLLEIRADGQLVSLTPSFKPDTTEYTAETAAQQVELTTAAEHRGAKVAWNEQTLTESSIPIELQEGENGIELVVQAENRSSKTYTLTIVRNMPESDEPEEVFSDTAGHWAEAHIREAVVKGMVRGYPDGTFRPDQPVTRAEFTVMLVGALQLDGDADELTFTDHEKIGAWAKSSIALAAQAGIVTGYTDGSFRPDDSITRVEAAMMIAKAMQLPWEADEETHFADNDEIPQWAKGAAEAIRKLGIVNGRSENHFVPYGTTTRAEAVVMLLRVLE